jgi:hypothetical protein
LTLIVDCQSRKRRCGYRCTSSLRTDSLTSELISELSESMPDSAQTDFPEHETLWNALNYKEVA